MEKQITDNRPPPLEIYHLSKATVDQMTKENLELKDALKALPPRKLWPTLYLWCLGSNSDV